MALLILCTVDQDADRANAIVGANVRAESRRGAPEFENDVYLFLHGNAKAAELFGDGQAKEPHFPHLVDDVLWNGVGLRHFAFARDQFLVDELADRVQQNLQNFGVTDHVLSSRPKIGPVWLGTVTP